MLCCLIKYMPYLLIVTVHHCLHTGTQTTPHSLHRNTTDKYFLKTLRNDSTKQVAEGTKVIGGVVWCSGLQVCRYGHSELGQIPLTEKTLFLLHGSDTHALTAPSLLGPSSKLTHRSPYPCELSPGLQAFSKQVPQVQDGAHQAALDDKFSLPFPAVNEKRGP